MIVDDVVGHEAADLGVVVNFGIFVIEVLGPGATVGDEKSWRIEDARPRHEFDDIFVKWRDRHAVLVAAESVQHVAKIEFRIQAAFGGGHDAFGLAGHHHPLALLAIAHQVRLQVRSAVETLVS